MRDGTVIEVSRAESETGWRLDRELGEAASGPG
jgi:hypothetical protein